ncbi:hemerythrin HHE cation-binding protein [Ectothiorhodospira haloalkaliphila]|uniref:Hemerythrin HHE cation-binding protein n=1 Tax=Ectothiorhodospira haloalkaliphila TaxID=421628 RepID=W8KUY8_9GAMM|nr:hemerythrin domain-containing protein [Ectothiorhodospira haloalkaliphila]AHK79401.1 hemerythrin HHE cation-binding protein [Ectothiorhodospira haloalkaliphila]
MQTIQDFFTHDHRDCDHRLADLETSVADKDWAAAENACVQFQHDLERHLQREETLLFPAIETFTGSSGGPTEVMRREHDQMRALLADVRDTLARQEVDACLGNIETLMTLIQLHNVKEEQILYPMADKHLSGQRDALMDQVRTLAPA